MTQITGKTGLTGLLGSPVAHSISPLMHNYSFQALDLDYVYLCFDVKEQGLKAAVEGLRALNVRGFNLTMPDKNRVLEYLDDLSCAARLIGAVNTVENQNGRLIGHNTDGIGFMRSAKEQGLELKGKTMTLLGAGGAATAICAQAALDGVAQLHIFLRSTSAHLLRMETLAENLSSTTDCCLQIHDIQNLSALQNAAEDSALLVNATSVGMAPDCENCLLPEDFCFPSNLTVADIIYNPWKTKLLSLAENAGCKTFNGYSMLLYQGAEAFRIWTGRDMPVGKVQNYLQMQE